MKRKVKIFTACDTDDGVDEEINAWIENYDKKLIDVKLTVIWEEGSDYVAYTATVIYIDKSEE